MGVMLDQHEGARFVHIATAGDLVEGRVLAARLEAEGIEVRLHSQAFGPYPMTVGQMAETEIWVLSDRVEEASTILLDAEVNTVLSAVESDSRVGLPWEFRVAALAIAAIVATLWILRVIRMF